MKKMKSTLPNMVIVLTAFTLVAGLLLGYVHGVTAPVAEEVATANRIAAFKEVVPPPVQFNNNPDQEGIDAVIDGIPVVIYPCKQDGQIVGAAIQSATKNGFSGEFTVMVGVDPEGNVLGYKVMKHAETPGLGAKMLFWFQKDGKGNIIGRNLNSEQLVVSKDGGDVDAITASTISSRAFLDAVNRAGRAWKEHLTGEITECATAATPQATETL